jgi:uncharacterized protein
MASWPIDFNAHIFEEAGQSYLFCAGSLYLYRIDPLTADVLKMAGHATSAETIAELGGRYGACEVEDTIREIEALVGAGILTERGAPLSNAADPGLRAAQVDLSDLWLIVTNRCNLRCSYCFSRSEYMHAGGGMPQATASAGIDFLLQHSGQHRNLTLIFFGGEPLLDMPLMQHAVAYAHQAEARAGKRIRFTITTNGVCLTESVRRFLIDERFSVMISMDGDKKMQDASRPFPDGRGSFDTVASNTKAFLAEALPADLSVTVRTTLNRTHLGHIVELYRFLEEEMGFEAISTPIIHHPAPDGFGFTLDDVPKFESELLALSDRFVERCRTAQKLPEWPTIGTFLPMLERRSRPVRGCSAGRRAICVDPVGDIYPCERFITLPEYRLGNVHRDGFDMDLVHRLSRLDSVGFYDRCKSCEALNYCKGTCTAERVRYHDATGPDEVICAIYRALLRVILHTYVRIDHKTLLRNPGGSPK